MDLVDIMREVIDRELKVLERVKEQLEGIKEEAMTLIETIINCKGYLLTCGVGTSFFTAGRFSHLLTCSGVPSLTLNPATLLHGGMGIIRNNDIVLIISKGGESEEMIELARVARRKGARVICLTEKRNSPLSQESDLVLVLNVSGADLESVIATGSSLAFSVFLDGICGAVVKKKGYNPEDFELIHPGGAVGRILREKRGEGR